MHLEINRMEATMFRILILCTYFLLVASSSRYYTPPSCPLDHSNHDPNYGFIATAYVDDEYDCMELCDDTPSCVAYNIELADMFCELNEGAVNGDQWGLDMVTRDNWSYWEKQTNQSSTSCANNTLFGRKQREVASLSAFTIIATRGDWAWYGKDALDTQDRVYYLYNYNRNDLNEYATETDFVSDTYSTIHYLSPSPQGNQYVVYGRKFWYREQDYRRVIIWDLDRDVMAGRIMMDSLPGTQQGPMSGDCQYNVGISSCLDIEVDESGIWFVWGRPQQDCYLSISKVDHINYKIIRTWDINGYQHGWAGNMFIIDGILYATDNYHNDPTWIHFQYNMRNNSAYEFKQNNALYVNVPTTGGHTSHMHYNPKDGRLYRTSHVRHGYMTINYKTIP